MFSSLITARRRLGLATGAMLALGALALPAGALADVGDPAPTAAAAPAAAEVAIGDFAFAADGVTISSGQSVTWTWNDGPHNVHVVQGPELFDSGIKAAGAHFTRALTVPGWYGYLCDVHPFMRGQITVTA